MSESDWTFLSDDPGATAIDRGVTNGIARPNGGGNFLFSFNSLVNDPNYVALYTNQSGYAPTAALKGASMRAALKRGVSGGPIAFSGFLFAGLGGTDGQTPCYMLGLGDADPYHLVLSKDKIANGTPDTAPGTQGGLGVLARSVATFAQDVWLHLRLDQIVNDNGDVLLQVFRNDLDSNPVTAPVWVPEPGLLNFIDDQTAINTGSQPLTSGRMGFGMESADINRRIFVDHVESIRQL